jgi:hypothetical protein
MNLIMGPRAPPQRAWCRALAPLIAAGMMGGCAGAPLRSSELPAAARQSPQDYVVIAVRNDATPVAPAVGATLRGYEAVRPYGPSPASRRVIAALAHDYGLETTAGWPIDALHWECVVFHVDGGLNAELLAKLAHDPRVRLAQPLNRFETLSGYDDPYAQMQKNIAGLDLAAAHRVARGSGVRVALIDTGVSVDHPDLAGGIVALHDYVGGGSAAFRHDVHGTEVAGVIAARANNHVGIVGVAPEAELIALKACWESAGAAHAVCNSFTLAQAIAGAVERRARIVNLSLTGPADPLLAELVTWGIERGVIFVGAVASDGRLDAFPAGVPGVLAVDRAEIRVHAGGVLYAPGDGILTLTPDAHYDFASGSSIATGEVSGLVALMLERRTLSPTRARDILLHSEGSAMMVNGCAALGALVGVECTAAVSAAPTESESAGH